MSGGVIEVYEYENPILEGYKDTKRSGVCGRSSAATDDDKEKNRVKVYNRAKRTVKRLINTNIGEYSKFVTLTFKDNITDIKIANYEFKKFKQRLERYLKHKLQYVAVIEFQKRGAIHYHVVMFNAPYIKVSKLRQIWRNGFVKINKIDNVDNVGAYVCKYMTKASCNDDRLKGQKMYFSSRGLEKPIEVKDKEKVENLAVALPSDYLTYENKFVNDYNTIIYKQYNLNKRVSKDKVKWL